MSPSSSLEGLQGLPMNARPYIFGCLCLVGAAGTAAASDIDPSGLLSASGSGVSSSFEGSSRSSQSVRDSAGGGDVAPARPAPASHRDTAPGTVAPPVDVDMSRDEVSPLRSSTPSWQSLLPGSML